ncbi:MAG: hypothetical protein MKZ95_01740, partial [Pirellulales bacterium]|nr:hypothetical protein [Pirellulales bacterium]
MGNRNRNRTERGRRRFQFAINFQHGSLRGYPFEFGGSMGERLSLATWGMTSKRVSHSPAESDARLPCLFKLGGRMHQTSEHGSFR